MQENKLGQTALKPHNWQKWLIEGGRLEEMPSQETYLVDLRGAQFVKGVGIVRVNKGKNK